MADDVEIEDQPEVEIEGEDAAPQGEGAKAPPPKAEDDPLEKVKANLAAEQRRAAEAEARARASEEARRQEAQRYQSGAVDSRLAELKSAREATDRQIQILSGQRSEALQKGDYAQEAKLNQQIVWHTTRIGHMDAGIAQFEAVKRDPQRQPEQPRQEQRQPQQQLPVDPVENFVARNKLSANAAAFIRENPGFIASDRRIRRLGDAHDDAVDAGHAPDTPAYYDFIRGQMAPAQARQEPAQQQQPARRPQVAAPPSRSGGEIRSGRPKLTITRAEAENARLIGVDLKDPRQATSYARELDKQRRGVA